MKNKTRVFIDQYSRAHYAHTLKELRDRLGGRISKMYIDENGETMHIGYVIGNLWLSEYTAKKGK
jgi:hypothetical protein